MSEISFEFPLLSDIIISDKRKAYTGQDYPLRDIGHRDFEKLIYCLYKQEINNKSIPFDRIALMRGIKDNGQDCVLYRNNIKGGIIQCKHSEPDSPLGLKSCVEEIIKFALYSLRDEELLPDLKSFTYFFASSSGFDTATNKYLRAFNDKIGKEKKLDSWTKSVLKKFSLLSQFSLERNRDQLLKILTNLKIELIIPEDIQTLLAAHQSVVQKFYEVRIVVDNSGFEDLQKELREISKGNAPTAINETQILNEFTEASFFLSHYKSSFSLKSPVKIKRGITESISNWIKSPLKNKEENVAILKGGAGSGKSVIMNNLYHLLIEDEIPTIALKADDKNASSIRELEQKLNLSLPLEIALRTLAGNSSKVVVIIDQVDALSQTLSANRDLLGTYLQLIEKLKKIENVRIVVSTREYDLSYDPYLQTLRTNTSFDASFLQEGEVLSVLGELGVRDTPQLLLKLLSTPLHLELFCQIYNASGDNTKYYSLYDLYNELWTIKIADKKHNVNRESTTKSIFSIASAMYKRQEPSVKSAIFDVNDIDYLKTEGLIITNDKKELLFFHQTFYDYVFARHFAESGKNVIEYLNENNQGLFVRSSLKIILAHTREYDPASYRLLITDLITGVKIRFHIKQLVINYLGFILEPNETEKELATAYLINTQYEEHFLESLNTTNWVKHAVDNGWLNKYFAATNTEEISTIYQLCLRNIDIAYDCILDFLLSLPDNEHANNFISQVLFFLKRWDSKATSLYLRSRADVTRVSHIFSHCIEIAAYYDEEWAFNEFQEVLISRIGMTYTHPNELKLDYSEIELIKKLYELNPSRAYIANWNVIEELINKTQLPTYRDEMEDKLIEDSSLTFFSRRNHLNTKEELFNILVGKTEELAVSNVNLLRNRIEEYSASNFVSILYILINGCIANPSVFNNEAFSLIQSVYLKNGLKPNGKLEYFVRSLIARIYPLLSDIQKVELNSMILSIEIKYENEVYLDFNTKKKVLNKARGITQHKFLSAIPYEELKKFPDVLKVFQELNRKFGAVKDSEPNIISISGVHPPYNTDNYEKMSLNDWEKTFLKYNGAQGEESFSFRGGVLEHSRAFEELVSKRPDFFYALIDRLTTDKIINDDYKVAGINGLIKAKYNCNLVYNLVVKQIKNDMNASNTLYTIWNIKYLVAQKKFDDVIFSFLCKQAVHNKSPEKETDTDLLQQGTNSVRGAAIDLLMRVDIPEYEIRLFPILSKISRIEKNLAVKSAIVFNAAYLIKANPSKAFKIFTDVVKSDKRLIKDSMWSAGYFAYTYFSKMKFWFEMALEEKNVHEELTLIIGKAWVRGIKGSEDYLFPLVERSDRARAQTIRIATNPENLIQPDSSLNLKCVELFKHSLSKSEQETTNQYSSAFLHFKPEMFESIFPILKAYSKSKVFKSSPKYFCDYVTKCCDKGNVDKCIELISHFDKLKNNHISRGDYYDSEPLNAILAIYNVLGKSERNKNLKNKCLDMFDRMLQQTQHRRAATRAIKLVEL